jgi:ABC-type nitrate/sulfonate/bicarbonate transport system substrate-binding protein
MKRTHLAIILTVLVLFVSSALFLFSAQKTAQQAQVIRIGITPYQDSALPIVADRKGWYRSAGLIVKFVPLTWDQVVPALSSGAIDAAIYNINSFSASYENAAKRSPKPLFYAPLYVFKGQAIMVHGGAKFKTVGGADGHIDIAHIAIQLKGKRIAVTKGTELEQIVLAALKKAGLTARDVTIIQASPEDSLAAFLAGSVDAFAGGLTERVEARRHGGIELLTEADVMRPVIDGLVTTDAFAASHKDRLDKLVGIWFQTIRYISADVPRNSQEIREYLRTVASTRYSPEEYAIAWTFDIFPADATQANVLFNSEKSAYYWKTSWDDVSFFLIEQKQITSPIPYSAYWGDKSLDNKPSRN